MARFTVGVDLGQASDFTALCVLDRQTARLEPSVLEPYKFTHPAETEPAPDEYHAVHLERIRGRSYPSIVAGVESMMGAAPLAGNSRLVLDRTGVGRAVFDMFVDAGLHPVGISIHGGDAVTEDDGGFRVPKRDLVGVVHRFMSERRLKTAPGLLLKDVLEDELGNFRYKLNAATAHDSYSAWREAEHDDVVLAVSLALWWAERSLNHGAAHRSRPRAEVFGPMGVHNR